jgi:hypothetical protein
MTTPEAPALPGLPARTLTKKPSSGRKQFPRLRLSYGMTCLPKIAMPKIVDPFLPFDVRTSRSICDAVGERLQRSLQPNSLSPSPHLLHLLEELRKQDEASDASERPQ